MVIAYLLIGVMFGGAAAALTWINGGGIILGFAAYSAGGAFAVLSVLAIHMLFSSFHDDQATDESANEALSA
jgi:membrane protein implicated in regulation of membrane protease activity